MARRAAAARDRLPARPRSRADAVRRGWLGREGSNLRMAESKSAALPLGYAPSRPGRHHSEIDLRLPAGRRWSSSRVATAHHAGFAWLSVAAARSAASSVAKRAKQVAPLPLI